MNPNIRLQFQLQRQLQRPIKKITYIVDCHGLTNSDPNNKFIIVIPPNMNVIFTTKPNITTYDSCTKLITDYLIDYYSHEDKTQRRYCFKNADRSLEMTDIGKKLTDNSFYTRNGVNRGCSFFTYPTNHIHIVPNIGFSFDETTSITKITEYMDGNIEKTPFDNPIDESISLTDFIHNYTIPDTNITFIFNCCRPTELEHSLFDFQGSLFAHTRSQTLPWNNPNRNEYRTIKPHMDDFNDVVRVTKNESFKNLNDIIKHNGYDMTNRYIKQEIKIYYNNPDGLIYKWINNNEDKFFAILEYFANIMNDKVIDICNKIIDDNAHKRNQNISQVFLQRFLKFYNRISRVPYSNSQSMNQCCFSNGSQNMNTSP